MTGLLPARDGSNRSASTARLAPDAVSSKNRRSSPASVGRREPPQQDAVGHRHAGDDLGVGLDEAPADHRRGASPGRRAAARHRGRRGRPPRRSCRTRVSSSARVPCAWIRPPPMIIIRSATASTSASRCEDSSTVPPRSAKPRRRPRIQRMPSGSRPLAGSSRISTSGSPSSAWAKPRRWRMPSEYWPTRLRAAVSSRPTSSSSSSTRCGRHAHRLGGDGERLAAAAPGVLRRGVEQDADATARVRQVAVAPAEDLGVAAVGLGEADEHPHRGGLAGAVGAEEARDGARLAAERDVGDDGASAELLGECLGFDHVGRLAAGRACDHGPGATLVEPSGVVRQRLW